MIAVHFENLLFLLFVAVAILFQLLARAASKASKNSTEEPRSTSTPPSLPRAPAESDEERIRKFLEALGQPTTSTPPPPVRPRTDIPPRPVAPVQPPGMRPFSVPTRRLTPEERRKRGVILHEGVPGTSEEWLRKINLPGQITKTPYQKKTFTPKGEQIPSFEVHEGASPSEPPPPITTPAEAYAISTQPAAKAEPPKTDIRVLLKSSSGLREAIILREIFGPPRSLQPPDLVGT
jgi:hypothetical protein